MKKSEFITVRIDLNSKVLPEKIAQSEDRTLSYIVNRIINDYLKGLSSPADKR